MTEQPETTQAETPPPQWKPLPPLERRVLGVLVEKAKTTPDAYPLSLNGIKTGCNQKSNRDPVMNVDEDALEDTLERLRDAGAVGLIQGSGRVEKFRHYAYQWLGVDKLECAVMAELLLRGAQTEGELRGRVSRMEPVADLPALRPVLDSLKQKKLIISLTPSGRGHVITHNLYLPAELERLQARYGGAVSQDAPSAPAPATHAPPMHRPPESASSVAATGEDTEPLDGPTNRPPMTAPAASHDSHQLREEVLQLQDEMAELKNRLSEMEEAMSQLETSIDELLRFKQMVEG